MIQEITLQRLLRLAIDQGVTPSVIGDRLTLTGDDRAVSEVEPVLRPFRDELARLLWRLLLDSRVDSAVVMGEPRTVAINRIAVEASRQGCPAVVLLDWRFSMQEEARQ